MADFDFSSLNTRSPYGSGFAGTGGRYGRYLDPRASPLGGDVNAGLQNLAKIALGGPTPVQQDAQSALEQDRLAQAQLRRAQLDKISSDLTASRQAKTEADAFPGQFVQTRYGVPGQQMLDYIAAKPVQPEAETGDQPGINGGYPTPAPAGLTPDKENLIRQALSGLQASRYLPGKTNYEQFEAGLGKAGVNDQVAMAGSDPMKLAIASARSGAVQGKPFFKEGGAGDTLNLYTGAQDQSSPLATANIGEKNAQAQAQRGAAAQHYAGAAKAQSETVPQVQVPVPGQPGATITSPGAIAAREYAKVQGQGATSLSDEALGPMAWDALIAGKNPPGMGNLAGAQRALVANKRAQIGHGLGLSDPEIAMLPVDNKVKQKALGNLVNWGATVDRSAGVINDTADAALQTAKQLDPTTIQLVNKGILAGRQQFNDPAANVFAQQLITLRREYGRLVTGPTSNAMLPVEAMKQADSMLSNGVDVPTLTAMTDWFKREAAITKANTEKQIGGLRTSMVPVGAPLHTGLTAASTGAPVPGGGQPPAVTSGGVTISNW